MSHLCGWEEDVFPNIHIGPDGPSPSTGPNTWQHNFSYLAASTQYVILHFMNVSLPANNRLEVDLGYGTDVFTAADGNAFWTRPVNIHQLPGGTIPIRYITNGSNSGGAFLDRYGRGQSLQTVEPGFDSITNCDPFLPSGWSEPDFPHIPGSTAPKYEPYWMCNGATPPVWQNAQCASVGSIQRDVARSVGIIISLHEADSHHPRPFLSNCSVTLIDSDMVTLAAHCISDHPFSVPAASVTFDYEVDCTGNVFPAYNAVFYKVRRLVKYRWTDGRDYAILQLRGAPSIPPVPVRNGFPAVGDPVFGVHHPNGAVKKISPSGNGTMPVTSTSATRVNVNFDVAGGSSGSGLFDMSGRLLGVLASGSACSLGYSSSQLMLNDPIQIPNPPTERAVMLVMDRSGSMSGAATGGGIKIDEAREAAELFISMMRTSMGNEAGLVSFASDASSPTDFPIDTLDAPNKTALLGVLPGIGPGGRTSVGDGLAAARNQLNTASGLPRSILVLTDGMENEPLAIADVTGLGTTEITAIGFGTESNLDGARLTNLAQTHGGYYKRAGTGLELRKFFALAFGDIFEAGALADPELHLGRDVREGPWVPFNVCGEEAMTVVVGWDEKDTSLLLEVRTPSRQVLNLSAGGIEMDAGQTWRFARIPLPQNSERDGTWETRVLRPAKKGDEFPPPAIPVNCFINVIARGGPSLRPFEQPKRLYTGDVLHPKVIFQYPDETVPPAGEVTLSVRRPDASVGTILAGTGLGTPKMVNGDVIPARQATLSQIEEDTGAPVTSYVEETHAMSSGAAAETFKYAGVYGTRLTDAMIVEGTYTFHARAKIQVKGCTLTREAQWSHHVAVGIDPDATTVTVTPSGDGGATVTFVPQDRYGNLVGPGAADDLNVEPLPGCTAVGGLVDLGDGSYQQKVECDPEAEDGPGLVLTQPGRGPVVLEPAVRPRTIYRYPVRLHCGHQEDCCGTCASLLPGRYATSISIFNGAEKPVPVAQAVLLTTFAGATTGRWPESSGIRSRERIEIGSMETTVVDCCTVQRMLVGAEVQGPNPMTSGTVLIESQVPLHVTATYTMVTGGGTGASIDVEVITPQRHVVLKPVKRQEPPSSHTAPPEPQRGPPPRPQDVLRRKVVQPDKDDPKRDPKTPVDGGSKKKGSQRGRAPKK